MVAGMALAQSPVSAEMEKPAGNEKTGVEKQGVEKPVVEKQGEEKRAEGANVPLLGRTNAQAGEAKRNENIFITAIDNNSQKEANVRLGTTATLVEEFQAQNRYFGAEFGNAPATPPHLSAGGAQALRANVQWTHGNSALSARSFFQVGAVQPARDNQVSAAIASGLGRNGQPGKGWGGRSYWGWDGSVQKSSGFVNGNVLVPRADERTCLSQDAAACALITRWFRAWPLQAPNRTDINERALNTNALQALDTKTSATRWEQELGAQRRVVARHTWTMQKVDAFQLVAGQNPDTTLQSHDARLTLLTAQRPGWNTELTAAFSRARSLLVPEPNAVGPQVVVGTAFERLGPGSSIPVDRAQNRYRVSARSRKGFGRTSLSFGYEFGRLHFNGSEASSNRGNMYFRNDFGLDAITNFRLGQPNRYSFGLGELARGFRRWEQNGFVQANWRVRPNVTLNGGVRYQPAQGMGEVDGLTEIGFRCDCNNWGPSGGFAWQMHRKLGRLRGAYSLQYGEIFPATLQQLRWNPPGFQKIEVQLPEFLQPLSKAVISPTARAIVFAVPDDLKTPYTHHANLQWELPLPRSWGRLDAGYVGTRTWKLLYMQYTNRALRPAGVPVITANINDRRPDKRYFDYRQVSNMSRAYYDAGRVNYALPLWRGMTWENSYWYSKAIDTGASYVNIAAGDDANQGQSQEEDRAAQDLRGPSAFDQAHAWLSRWSYLTPGGWRAAVPGGGALANWRMSAVFVAKSGIPFTVITGSDAPGYGNVDGVSGDRPMLLQREILGRTISHPDLSRQLLPRAAFGLLGPNEMRGNLGVGTFRRAGMRNLNASLERQWSLGQDGVLGFRAEAINLLNTPQFAEPNVDLSNPAFGLITNTLNDGRTFKFTLRLQL